MRVFLDTNVLASAFATRGLCEDVLREVLANHELIVSPLLLDELERVLRKKFNLPRVLASEILKFLKQETLLYEAGSLPALKIKDRGDLILLSSALMGKADIFVTGDKELIELRKVKSLQVLSPRAFWEKLTKTE